MIKAVVSVAIGAVAALEIDKRMDKVRERAAAAIPQLLKVVKDRQS